MSHIAPPGGWDAAKLQRISWIVLAITLLGAIAWTVRSAIVMKDEAQAALEPLKMLSASPAELDQDRLLMENSQVHARKAHAAADALPMRIVAHLPFFGDDIQAVRIMVTALDNVVTKAGVPLVDVAAKAMDVPKVAPGQPKPLVNTTALAGLTPKVETAATTVHTAREELDGINASAIVDQLSVPVTQATDLMTRADTVLQQARTMSPIIADAAGTSGSRDYLLVFQNLAEARPTGGLFGKWALIRVDRGTIKLLDIGANENLVDVSLKQLPPLAPDFLALYRQGLGPVANDNLTPNFPDAARLLLASWRQQGRKLPAGVVSVDTNAVAGFLSLTGAVTVSSPALDSSTVVDAGNAVQVVQADVYQWFEGKEEARQQYLSALTSTVLGELSNGSVPIRNIATMLQRLVAQHQVMAYFVDPKAQASLVDLGAAGALPEPTADQALVYVTDNGGAKLGQYTQVSTCSSAGQLGVALTNAVPGGPLPAYVLNHAAGVDKRSLLVTVAWYLPAGRGISRATVNGRQVSVQGGSERHWAVVRVPLTVLPGQTDTVVLTLTGNGTKPTVATQSLTRSVRPLNGVCR